VENGLQVDVDKALPGILKKVKEALRETPNIKAILLECTELPPYADAIRKATGLPVYDAITNCDFVMSAFLDNERFGVDAWYNKWDGVHTNYSFGQELSPEQQRKLINAHALLGNNAMHRIMDHVAETYLLKELSHIKLRQMLRG
jgi:hypothetical protein